MLKEIQYLRAIAVLMVTYNHAQFVGSSLHLSPYFALMARTGVDIFFVISGYVVSSSLFHSLVLHKNHGFITNLEANVGSLKAFFIKRIFRLFPVAFLLVAANILVKLLFPHAVGNDVTESVMALFSHITMQTDMDAISFSANNQIFRNPGHFWSLAVEERFYLIVPMLIILCATPRRFMGLAVSFIVGLGILKALYPFNAAVLFHSGFLRFDSFMFGILVYLLQAHTAVLRKVFAKEHSRVTMNMLSILLIIIAARLPVSYANGTVIEEFGGSAYYYLAVYSISAILVAMAAQDKGYVLSIPGLKHVLSWFGEKSYNIYVFEFFYVGAAVRLASKLGFSGEQYVATSLIFFAILFITSEIIYRAWEKPLRELGRRIAAQITTS